MRKVQNDQMLLGEIDVTEVTIDLKSRDEIPQLLRGLQGAYADKTVRQKIFEKLRELIPPEISPETGRPGMHLWRLYVLGNLRLNSNIDYDRVQELANNHRTLRQILGHGLVDDEYYYSLQTIKDNIRLLSPKILNEINASIVTLGHQVVGHQPGDPLSGKCDSFVLETNVHFPTDINLLLDAMNKSIILTARLCNYLGLSDWRQSNYNFRKIKKLYRIVQKTKHSNSNKEGTKAKQEKKLKQAYETYLDVSESFLEKAEKVIATISSGDDEQIFKQITAIQIYVRDGRHQIDLIRRRIFKGETIPHDEKIFSIFERHTEWICKGKAGVPQELGMRVCLITDQYGFILNHQVLKKQTDDKVAVAMVETTKSLFPTFDGCSFDKGFYTPANRNRLLEYLKNLVMPKKGRLSKSDEALENDPEFITARRKHSAIESAINALENHGLDRCLDHGEEGFERYVALACVARNLQILGRYLMDKDRKSQTRRARYNATRQRNLAVPQRA